MILSAHYLWSHVAWGSTCIGSVIWPQIPGYPQIRQIRIALLIQNEIFRLQISMDNIIFMEIFQRKYYTGNKEA
jgi:hypothetical protein